MMILALFAACPFMMPPDSVWKVPFSCTLFIAFFAFGIQMYQALGHAVNYAISGVPILGILFMLRILNRLDLINYSFMLEI